MSRALGRPAGRGDTTTPQRFFPILEVFSADLNRWLVHYGAARPRQGYGAMRRRPDGTITGCLGVRVEAL